MLAMCVSTRASLLYCGTVLSEYLAFEALSERANGTECMHESAQVICEKREKIGQIEATLNLLCKGDPHENTILWTCKLTPYVRRTTSEGLWTLYKYRLRMDHCICVVVHEVRTDPIMPHLNENYQSDLNATSGNMLLLIHRNMSAIQSVNVTLGLSIAHHHFGEIQSNAPSLRVCLSLSLDPKSRQSLPFCPDPHPWAPTYLNLLPVQVKLEEIPISLEELRQLQSLQRPLNYLGQLIISSLLLDSGPCRTSPHHWTSSVASTAVAAARPLAHSFSPKSTWQTATTTASAPGPSSIPPAAECNHFLSQLLIYWQINTALFTIKLKVQVALSLLDGDARTWATPIFAQLASVAVGVQGAVTLFADVKAFLMVFKGCFGNLDDATSAQVELTKLCADKSMRERCTATEFSTLFKGPADHSGYGDLELHDKYLSGIPSCVYRKIELEMFTTWEAAEKRTTEVKQQLDISQACQPELNSFFSARGGGHSGACGGAP
ncbi:predicted protein [Postia placenta Mad-698-R]|nr:predicted protein [Postia placenta Mad-698-R]